MRKETFPRMALPTVFCLSLLALVLTVPAQAACSSPQSCKVGPCVALDLLGDSDFSLTDCPLWQWQGASREYNSECGSPWPGPAQTWVAEFDTAGGYYVKDQLWQDVTIPAEYIPGDPLELSVSWKVIGAEASYWDRLNVSIRNPMDGSVIEQLGGIRGNTAPTSCTRMELPLNGVYQAGDSIRVHFESRIFTPGTAFYIEVARLWWYFY